MSGWRPVLPLLVLGLFWLAKVRLIALLYGLSWVSGVSGGKEERWKRKRERAEALMKLKLPPPPPPSKISSTHYGPTDFQRRKSLLLKVQKFPSLFIRAFWDRKRAMFIGHETRWRQSQQAIYLWRSLQLTISFLNTFYSLEVIQVPVTQAANNERLKTSFFYDQRLKCFGCFTV